MKLDNNNHSVFDIKYCLVMTTHHRKHVIFESISARLKEKFEYISLNNNIKLTEWEYEPDYIKVKFKAHPNTELTKFINSYKSAGSRLIKKEFSEVSKIGGQFWSNSFLLISLGEEEKESINEYLQSQLPGIDRRRRENREI